MRKEYHEAKEIITEAQEELEAISKTPNIMQGGEENLEAFFTVKDVEHKLEEAKETLEYLGLPTKEGTITEDSERGEFYISYEPGEKSHMLSSGSSLEILIWGEWIIGRVETNSDGKYYFTGDGQPLLAAGMQARLRIIEAETESRTP